MPTLGILVCDSFDADQRNKYQCEYEDLFIDRLLEVDPDLSFITYNVQKDIFPTAHDQCDGWLITGSRCGAYDGHDWIAKLEDFLRQAYAQEIPLIGVCFGHQILAQSLGGRVEKSHKGWGIGLQHYQLLEPFAGLTDTLDLYAIHQDQVVDVPPTARVFAKTDHCPHAGLLYEGRAVSLQPHPEFSAEFEKSLIVRNRGNKIDTELADKAIASLENSQVHGKEIMTFFADFIKG
ncbi:MAG: type 1 glutamine amidotransferase [Methylocystaceae bacterium]|nr:type 1 glutamine amidotransferase [Methylocystaceae bacterium]